MTLGGPIRPLLQELCQRMYGVPGKLVIDVFHFTVLKVEGASNLSPLIRILMEGVVYEELYICASDECAYSSSG